MTNQTTQKTAAVIFVTAANIPALSFAVNDTGENIGAYWKVDADGYEELAVDRVAATNREAALYFTPAGVLDLTAWLAIRQRRAVMVARAEREIDTIHAAAMQEVGRYPTAALRNGERSFPNQLDPREGVTLGESVTCEHSAFIPKMAYEAWESGQGVRLAPSGPYLSKAKGDDCPAAVLAAIEWQKAFHAALENHGLGLMDSVCSEAHELLFVADRAVMLAPAYSYQDVQAKLTVMTSSFSKLDMGAELWAAVNSLQADMIRAA